MKQKSLLLIVALFAMQGMWAEHPIVQYSLDPQIVEHRNLNGLQGYLNGLVNINFDQLVFEYTSLAPDQKSTVRLTASINMPGAVYNKTSKARALVLYNQYTTCKKRERISQDNYDDASLLFNKFERFISISPDLYGWTLTEDKPQTYCCPEILAIETVDAWDAAMMLLEQEGYDYKDLPAFNVGYSSGGYYAMAVQKYVDEKRPDIFFTATSTGGAPYDFTTVLETYVKTNFTGYQCALPLVIVAYNETYNLGLDYKDIFLPPLCDKIDEWIISKDYTSWDINDLIGQLQYRCHSCLVGFRSDLHQPAALGHETKTLFHGERSCVDQCRQLAQRISGGHIRVDPLSFQRRCHSQVNSEYAGLRISRFHQFCLIGFETLPGCSLPDRVSLCKNLCCCRDCFADVLAHARCLCALSGEYKCYFTHSSSLRNCFSQSCMRS